LVAEGLLTVSDFRSRAPELRKKLAEQLADALTEIDLRIEAEAKAELYPGHGKVTGTLQRSIYGAPGRVEGEVVRGEVGTKGVPYALRIHKLYGYIAEGLAKVKPLAAGIVRKHTRR
jgi:hypothetical protein